MSGGILVGVGGEADDTELREVGHEVVTPSHGNLRRYKIHLNPKQEIMLREGGREGGRAYLV